MEENVTTLEVLAAIRDWCDRMMKFGNAYVNTLVSAGTNNTDNKLANVNFVNSSINTATATFRGNYNAVSDLGIQTLPASHSDIATAIATKMTALSITPDNNDYVFVEIPTAVATPTEIARVERYKYNGSAWSFEYSINNSGFTAAQWAAINSGITNASWLLTPEFVEEDPAETDLVDQYADLLQQLYQAITDAQNAKADYVGDDNYVYHWDGTQGKYVKTNKYVKGDDGAPGTTDYNQLQNKPALKTVATSGSYNDLTDKPAIPTVPSNVSAFNNDSGYITASAITNDIEYVEDNTDTFPFE